MNSSPWLHSQTSPAICPKCHAPALHRSHTQSRFEERRKRMTGKRPYRCHSCGMRSWYDEAELHYPTSAQKPMAPGIAGKDVPVPDLHLEEGNEAPTPVIWESEQSLSSNEEAGRNTAAKPHAPVSERAHSIEPEASVEQAVSDFPAEDAEEGYKLPDFDGHSGRPVSSKVTVAFHHHARNKSASCPACGDFALYRSRARNLKESLRKRLTRRRPYRCHHCGWRGWMKK